MLSRRLPIEHVLSHMDRKTSSGHVHTPQCYEWQEPRLSGRNQQHKPNLYKALMMFQLATESTHPYQDAIPSSEDIILIYFMSWHTELIKKKKQRIVYF